MIILTRVLKFILDIMSSILIIINIIYYISSDFTLYLLLVGMIFSFFGLGST